MMAQDDDRTAVAILAGLHQVGPRRLGALLEAGTPAATLTLLASGQLALDERLAETLRGVDGRSLFQRWVVEARTADPAAVAHAHDAAGLVILMPDDADWPARFQDDPEPPAVLFVRGSTTALSTPACVAIVGTRRCTNYGREVAAELGARLAGAGVTVVSGCALGIDGASQSAALAAGGMVVGVVATGLDVMYPPRHRSLIDRIADSGAVVSEWPLGTDARRWRFPARNRIIAALSDLVVVVESGSQGGSLYTVDAAEDRDRPVMAVPGSIRSPTSSGTNLLLLDGRASPLVDPDDVLVHLGLTAATRTRPNPEVRADPTPEERQLLDLVDWCPTAFETIVLATGADWGEVRQLLAHLEAKGWLHEDGGWWERC